MNLGIVQTGGSTADDSVMLPLDLSMAKCKSRTKNHVHRAAADLFRIALAPTKKAVPGTDGKNHR